MGRTLDSRLMALAVLLSFAVLQGCVFVNENSDAFHYLKEVTAVKHIDTTPEQDNFLKTGNPDDTIADVQFRELLDQSKFSPYCVSLQCNTQKNLGERIKIGLKRFLKRMAGKKTVISMPENNLKYAECSFIRENYNDIQGKYTDSSKVIADMIDELKKQGNGPAIKTSVLPDQAFIYFMIGAGSNGGEFEAANRYCGNGMRLEPEWLVGNPYPMPISSSAGCYAEYNVIPLYILYSGKNSAELTYTEWGELIKKTEEIAKKLNKQNSPVIVTTEINLKTDYDPDKTTWNAALQAKAILENCDRCLVAITPEFNNYELLIRDDSQVKGVIPWLKELSGDKWNTDQPTSYANRTIIGQGLIINEIEDFRPINVIKELLLPTSLPRVMQSYDSYPTLLIYIGAYPEEREIKTQSYFGVTDKDFDSNGDNINMVTKKIYMDEKTASEAFMLLFDSIPLLTRSGIIGFSALKANSMADDYLCNGDCFSLIPDDGVGNPLSYQFFTNCHNYSIEYPNPIIYGQNGAGEMCNFANYFQEDRKIIYGDDMLPSPQDMENELEQIAQDTPVMSCQGCLGRPPDLFMQGLDFSRAARETMCDRFSNEISYWTNQRQLSEFPGISSKLDPVLIRALIWQENRGFDPRARNRVSSACGLGQIVQGTWEGMCKGECGEWNKCTEASPNICCSTKVFSSYIDNVIKAVSDPKNANHDLFKSVSLKDDHQYNKWMVIYLGIQAYHDGPGGLKTNINRWKNAKDGIANPEVTPNCYKDGMEFPEFMFKCMKDREAGPYAVNVIARYMALINLEKCNELCFEGINDCTDWQSMEYGAERANCVSTLLELYVTDYSQSNCANIPGITECVRKDCSGTATAILRNGWGITSIPSYSATSVYRGHKGTTWKLGEFTAKTVVEDAPLQPEYVLNNPDSIFVWVSNTDKSLKHMEYAKVDNGKVVWDGTGGGQANDPEAAGQGFRTGKIPYRTDGFYMEFTKQTTT